MSSLRLALINLYVTPVEGITVVVDLEEVKITKYSDNLVVPIPKRRNPRERSTRGSKQKPPFGPHLNGATVLLSGVTRVQDGREHHWPTGSSIWDLMFEPV
ncbi:hypothetical protein M0R45_020546 [Rubus argutus]|uniref:Uncharacterized protein n=1 Tax=Rubus argutus TaxID=59490 RepID=A0AAW1X8Q4_RUBAR